MRIAGTSYLDSMVNQINLLTTQQVQLENEASTGQSITAPSDNPTGMGEALDLQADNSALTQYSQNISTLQSRATIAGNALTSLQTLAEQASEIATQAGGATTGPADLKADATQVTQLIQQAAELMNTQDNGQYVFGGTASSSAPYTVSTDADGNVTAVTYSGNSSVNETDIGQNATITADAPGENNTGTGARGIISDSRYGADFFNHLISLQKDLLSGNTSAITSTDATNLTNDDNNIIYQVANNGAAQSRLTAAASYVSTQQSGLQTSLSNVAGADMAQTLSQLSQTQNSYQAALQTSSQFMQMQQYVLSQIP
jgi:flagellar hook-associated protein 3 FlgL